IKELRVDGGATQNDLLMQFQADILGIPIIRPEVLETTAMGAAYLAGLATGFWDDIEELKKHWKVDKRFEPNMKRSKADELTEQWHRAVERSKSWIQKT